MRSETYQEPRCVLHAQWHCRCKIARPLASESALCLIPPSASVVPQVSFPSFCLKPPHCQRPADCPPLLANATIACLSIVNTCQPTSHTLRASGATPRSRPHVAGLALLCLGALARLVRSPLTSHMHTLSSGRAINNCQSTTPVLLHRTSPSPGIELWFYSVFLPHRTHVRTARLQFTGMAVKTQECHFQISMTCQGRAWLRSSTPLLRPASLKLTFALNSTFGAGLMCRAVVYVSGLSDTPRSPLVFCIGVMNIGICAHEGRMTK